VEIATKFPFMQDRAWSQAKVLEAGKFIAKLPDDGHEWVAAILAESSRSWHAQWKRGAEDSPGLWMVCFYRVPVGEVKWHPSRWAIYETSATRLGRPRRRAHT
jgi:hypothetical protein